MSSIFKPPENGYSTIGKKTIRLTYVPNSGWECSSGQPNGVDNNYLPPHCRNDFILNSISFENGGISFGFDGVSIKVVPDEQVQADEQAQADVQADVQAEEWHQD
jgi:hypothetical protein